MNFQKLLRGSQHKFDNMPRQWLNIDILIEDSIHTVFKTAPENMIPGTKS